MMFASARPLLIPGALLLGAAALAGSSSQLSSWLSSGRSPSASPTGLSRLSPPFRGRGAPASTLRPRPAVSVARLPLAFEANLGQSDRQVKFLARTAHSTLFLTP